MMPALSPAPRRIPAPGAAAPTSDSTAVPLEDFAAALAGFDPAAGLRATPEGEEKGFASSGEALPEPVTEELPEAERSAPELPPSGGAGADWMLPALALAMAPAIPAASMSAGSALTGETALSSVPGQAGKPGASIQPNPAAARAGDDRESRGEAGAEPLPESGATALLPALLSGAKIPPPGPLDGTGARTSDSPERALPVADPDNSVAGLLPARMQNGQTPETGPVRIQGATLVGIETHLPLVQDAFQPDLIAHTPQPLMPSFQGAATGSAETGSISASPAAASSLPVPTAPATPPGTQILRLRLKPESLGEITVSLKLQGESLGVTISGANARALEALRQDDHAVRRVLEQSGYDLQSLVIRVVSPSETAIPAPAGARPQGQSGAFPGTPQGQPGNQGQGASPDGRNPSRQPPPSREQGYNDSLMPSSMPGRPGLVV